MTRVVRASSLLTLGGAMVLASTSCSGPNFSSRSDADGGGARGGASGASGSVSSGGSSKGGAQASGGAHGGTTSAGGARATGGTSGKGGAVGSGGSKGGAGGAQGTGGQTTMPDPISTVGLVYWFSADVGVTETAGFVSRWDDRSGNGVHAAQISAASRPTLGQLAGMTQPSVVFDGADDYLALPPLTADFKDGVTFFAVAQSTTTSGCTAMLEVSNGAEVDDISFDWLDSKFGYEVLDGFAPGQDGAFTTGETRLLEVTHATTEDVSLWVNGLSSGVFTFALPVMVTRNQNFIGKTLYQGCPLFSGSISEIILYSRTLPLDERTAAETYLQAKWGCCSN